MNLRRLSFLLCLLALTGTSAAAPTTRSVAQDFSYHSSACPFDTTALSALNLQCGYLTVPENRERNDGRRIRLAVAVMKARKPASGNSTVVVLTGGPGAEALSPSFLRLAHMLLGNRDVVVLDQRGVGYSKPSLCNWFGTTSAEIRAMNLTEQQAQLMDDGALRACHDELRARGVDLSAYNVIENAADINDLRKALGCSQWNLAGGSYGGQLEQVEIRNYPAGVRSAVLFGPVPIGMLGGDNVRSFSRSLKRVFVLCKSTKECARAYPDLKRKFYATINALRSHPLEVKVAPSGSVSQTYVINSQDFVDLIFEMLYKEGGVSHFPAVVNAFYRRDGTEVGKFLAAGLGGSYRITEGMFKSDVCYDAPVSRSHWMVEAAAHPDLESIGFWNEVCDYWESKRATPEELRSVKSDIPVLVINGGLDPIMPPRFIKRILEGFPHAKHIFLPQGTHDEPSQRTGGCLRSVVNAFLTSPSSDLGASCVKDIAPLKFSVPEVSKTVSTEKTSVHRLPLGRSTAG